MADAIDAAISALEEIVGDKTNNPDDRISAAHMILDRSYQIRPPSPDKNGEKDNPEGDVAVKNTGDNHSGSPCRSSSDMFNAITQLLDGPGGGRFGLSRNAEGDERWTAALEWGEEEEGSDMYGGAAYGVASIPALAVEKALRDAGK